MAVPVQGGNGLGNGPPVTLFQTPLSTDEVPSSTRFDATADGRRFLMIVSFKPASAPSTTSNDVPITAIVNWASTLRRK